MHSFVRAGPMASLCWWLFAFATLASANNHRRQTSPHGKCGKVKEKNVDKTYGYCGKGSEYCGTGCQKGFGSCNGSANPTSGSGSGASASASASATSGAAAAGPSPLNQCGPSVGHSCQGGLCCSQYGWCGNSLDYCGAGCQSSFGTCESGSGAASSASSSGISTAASGASSSASTTASAASSGASHPASSSSTGTVSGSASGASSASSSSSGASGAASGASSSASVSAGSSATASGASTSASISASGTHDSASASSSAAGNHVSSSASMTASETHSSSSPSASASESHVSSSVSGSATESHASLSGSMSASGATDAASASSASSGSSVSTSGTSSSASTSASQHSETTATADHSTSSSSQSASGTASSTPSPSPLNSCGAEARLSCQSGLCCSKDGQCGSSLDHCGAGCQSAFGMCESVSAPASSASETPSASSTVPSSAESSAPGRCGPSFNQRCQPGYCCSEHGWCGDTTEHCRAGCQSSFGQCETQNTNTGTVTESTTPTASSGSSSASSSATSTAFPISSNGQCGPEVKLACPSGFCCSRFGSCGATTEYCGSGCQSMFGKCGTDQTGPRCGPNFGNANCPTGQCCGQSGQCGYGETYCAVPGCQTSFGACDKSTVPAGPDTTSSQRPKDGNVPYGSRIDKCTQPNTIALTFDDGPSPHTGQVLDLLASYNVRATFFVLGKVLNENPQYQGLVSRMIAEGHQVASHSYSHPDMSTLTDAERRQQLHYTETAIANIINKFPTYFRAPYLSCDGPCQSVVSELGYHLINIDFDTKDFETPRDMSVPKKKVDDALNTSPAPQSLLSLQHDTVELSVTELTPYFLERLTNKGLKAVTVGECMGDEERNWYRSP